MPVLKLHFGPELLNEESFDDLLAVSNKPIQDRTKHFKDREQYLRQILRDYVVATTMGFRRWEISKVITIQGKAEKRNLELWAGEDISVLEAGEGTCLTLNIGDLQLKYLERALIWENTFQDQITNSHIIHDNVAELALFVLTNAILSLQRQVLEEQLRLEEAIVLDENSY